MNMKNNYKHQRHGAEEETKGWVIPANLQSSSHGKGFSDFFYPR